MPRLARSVVLVAFAASLGACGYESHDEATPARVPVEVPSAVAPAARVELDALGGRTVGGLLTPAPEASDAERTVTLDGHGLPTALGSALAGRVVTHAALVEGGVLLIERDHTLVRVRDDGSREVLDANVVGPLSARGTRVAYVHGEFPVVTLRVLDLTDGLVRDLAREHQLTWSPALAEDGRTVVVVSSVDGESRLVRATIEGEATLLPLVSRTPSSAEPPRLDLARGRLSFTDEYGPAELDLETMTLVGQGR